jgi:hypothetical protein
MTDGDDDDENLYLQMQTLKILSQPGFDPTILCPLIQQLCPRAKLLGYKL